MFQSLSSFAPLAALLLLVPVACQKAPPSTGAPTPSVTVAKPVPKQLTEWDEFTGRLAAVAGVELRARVSGHLQSTHVKEGTIIKEGDLLFVVDPRPYEAELARYTAELARARAALELATAEAGRASRLVETRAISAEEADVKVKTRSQAEASLAAAQAQVDQAKLEVEWCQVTSPIRGRVGRKLVTEGNLITNATVLTTIVQLDPIYCYFDVDERSALKYRALAREGTRESALDKQIPAQMALANEQGFPHEGVIDFVDNELSMNTGSIRSRAVFPNPDRGMSPGFFARVRIPGSGKYEAMLARDNAIGSDQGRPYVYVVGADNMAHQRNVTLGPLEDGLRIVREGLKAEDRVVINGLMSVRNGVAVKPEEAPMVEPPAVAAAQAPAAAR